jgi:diguanylate cyclase (GGDEF)-like protein/PAS domain S-box-containing protein
MEEALKESEIRYRNLVEGAHELIVSLGQDGSLEYVNQTWLTLMGYSHEESKTLRLCDTVDEDSRQICREAFNRVVSGTSWRSLEVVFMTKQGGKCVVEGNLTPRYQQGKVTGVLGVFRDISQKKAMDELLRRSERHYRLLMNNAIDMIIVLDADGTIRYLSPSVEANTGFSRQELYKHQIFDLIHPDDLPAVRMLFGDRLKTAGEITSQEIRVRRKDREWMTVEIKGNNLLSDPAISGIVINARDVTARLKMQQELQVSEAKHRMLLNSIQSPVLALKRDMTIFFCNQSYADFVGLPMAQLAGAKLLELFPNFAATKSYAAFKKALQDGETQVTEGMVKGAYLKARIFPMDWGLLSIAEDISTQHQAIESLKNSEERFRSLADSAADAIISVDPKGRVVFWNRSAERIFGYQAEEMLNEDVEVLTPERFREPGCWWLNQATKSRENDPTERTIEMAGRKRDGQELPMEITFSTASVKGQELYTFIIRDISERKKAEKQFKYLSFHDALTGLYNRAYFEEEMQRLTKTRLESVGLLICDVDGLKLVNDTMGHKTGDGLLVVIAGIISDACRYGDVVARIGGDEFAAILPNSTKEVVEQVCSRVRQVTAAYNSKNPELPLSLSMGWVVRPVKDLDPNRLFHTADDEMYREKVRNHDQMVSNFIQALQKKNLISEEQIEKMGAIMKDLAKEAGLEEKSLTEMEKLARYHDIGNVLVSDRILLKAGHLDRTEEEEMKRHCEIGYHIVMATPHLMPQAEWILKHHERWDGSGYPQGLKGDNIPVESRIVSLAAAYMAMRQDRPHAKAMSHENALEEIKREAGKQFDPKLVEKFLKIAHKWKKMPNLKAK